MHLGSQGKSQAEQGLALGSKAFLSLAASRARPEQRQGSRCGPDSRHRAEAAQTSHTSLQGSRAQPSLAGHKPSRDKEAQGRPESREPSRAQGCALPLQDSARAQARAHPNGCVELAAESSKGVVCKVGWNSGGLGGAPRAENSSHLHPTRPLHQLLGTSKRA